MKKKWFSGIAVLTALVVAFGAWPCYAAGTQEELEAVQQEKEESTAALEAVKDRLASIEEKKGDTETYLEELSGQLTELADELAAAQKLYAEKQKDYDLVSQELEDAKLKEKKQRSNMALRIQYMYENSTNTGLLEAVFSAESFRDFLTRANNIAELSNYDREMLDQYIAVCEVVEDKQAKVDKERKEVEALRGQCEEKRAQIQAIHDSTAEELKKLTDSIEKDKKAEKELTEKIREQEDKIGALYLQAAIETATASANTYGGGSGGAVTVQPVRTESGETEYQVVTEGGEVTTVSANEAHNYVNNSTWDGPVLTYIGGVNQGPSGKETWYSENIDNVVQIMRNMGNTDEYWVRDDGVKMLGDYVIVAANLQTHPRGSIVESSLGTAIVCDTGGFAAYNPNQLDIAVNW